MACKDPVKRALDKLLMEDGIMGYQIKDGEVIIFVENDDKAKTLAVKEIQGHKVTVKVTGRFVAL